MGQSEMNNPDATRVGLAQVSWEKLSSPLIAPHTVSAVITAGSPLEGMERVYDSFTPWTRAAVTSETVMVREGKGWDEARFRGGVTTGWWCSVRN